MILNDINRLVNKIEYRSLQNEFKIQNIKDRLEAAEKRSKKENSCLNIYKECIVIVSSQKLDSDKKVYICSEIFKICVSDFLSK